MTRVMTMAVLLVAASGLRAQETPSATRANGQVFRIGIGPSVAAAGGNVRKYSVMAVRTEGCSDAASASITATAEGLIGNERKSVALVLTPAGPPGVYGVEGRWPSDGVWVLSFKGSCGASQAGTVVPTRAGGFSREGAVFLTHAPTPGDVQESLKALAAANSPK